MTFHIVTDKCFLACDKVISVVLEEVKEQNKAKKLYISKSKKVKKVTQGKKSEIVFTISISYYPLTNNPNQRNNGFDGTEQFLEFQVTGKDAANKLYKEIIKEVQEQHPNEGYLDTLVDRVLSGSEFKVKVEDET